MPRTFAAHQRFATAFLITLTTSLAVADDTMKLRELTELRTEGRFERANQLLEEWQREPGLSDETKQRIAYELGVTQLEAAHSSNDALVRAFRLTQARTFFEKFRKDYPNHALATSAASSIVDAWTEESHLLREEIKKAEPSERVKFRKAAAEALQSARLANTTLIGELRDRLSQIPKVIDQKRQPKLVEQREQWRADYLKALLLSAAILEESVEVQDLSEEQRNEILAAAAAEYHEVYTKYRTRLAGSYARMYEGRSLAKIQKYREALDCYNDLLELPNEPAPFRSLRSQVLVLASNCWLSDEFKAYDRVLERGVPQIETATPMEQTADEQLQLRLKVARAADLKADALRRENPGDPKIQELRKLVQTMAQFVADRKGPYQAEAQQILGDRPGK